MQGLQVKLKSFHFELFFGGILEKISNFILSLTSASSAEIAILPSSSTPMVATAGLSFHTEVTVFIGLLVVGLIVICTVFFKPMKGFG